MVFISGQQRDPFVLRYSTLCCSKNRTRSQDLEFLRYFVTPASPRDHINTSLSEQFWGRYFVAVASLSERKHRTSSDALSSFALELLST